MIVAISFCQADLPLALANLTFIQSLGGCTEFECLLATDDQTPYAEMQRVASMTFGKVDVLIVPNVQRGWPHAANTMFERTMYRLAHSGQATLFMEPDVTVTRSSSLKEIDASYMAHGTPFMGSVRPTYGRDAKNQRITIGKHMNGMGVYPAGYYHQSDIIRYLDTQMAINPATGRPSTRPFDVQLADEIMTWNLRLYESAQPSVTDSPLFAHSWKTRNYRMEGGRIVCDQDDPSAHFDEPNIRIPALIHGAKDTSLIELIRAQMPEPPVQSAPSFAIAGVPEPEPRDPAPVDPEYAEFLAWKAQRSQPLSGIQMLPEKEVLRQRDEIVSVLNQGPIVTPNGFHSPPPQPQGIPAFVPVAPREPRTQAELDAARAAIGGFASEFDSPLGTDLPTGLMSVPGIESFVGATAQEVVQVAPIPEFRETEASVASGTQVISVDDTAKIDAIKADYRGGMKWRDMMKTHRVNSQKLKAITSEVDAEEVAA